MRWPSLVVVVMVLAPGASRAGSSVVPADAALRGQLTLDIPDAKRVRLPDAGLLRVIAEEDERVRVLQDVDGLRLAVWVPRRDLQRVAIREIGIAPSRGGAAPSGDEDGVYARPGLAVGAPDHGRARVRFADGGVSVDGWIDEAATGFVFTPDLAALDAIAGEGTTITDRHGRRLARLTRAAGYRPLDGKRAAIVGDGWIVRGTMRLRDDDAPLERFRHGIGADLVQGPVLRVNDCLYDDHGALVGLARDERDTVPVDTHGDYVVEVDTVAGRTTVRAHGDGHGGFVSCDP